MRGGYFDTDIGSSTDDLFALEMLYRYEQQGQAQQGQSQQQGVVTQ